MARKMVGVEYIELLFTQLVNRIETLETRRRVAADRWFQVLLVVLLVALNAIWAIVHAIARFIIAKYL